MFPQQVLDDLTTGYEYYSALNEGFIADLKKGCNNCLPKQGKCLMGLLISLKYKASVGVFDTESISLYNQMMEIIGGEAYVPVEASIFFGTSATDTTLTLEQILAGTPVAYSAGDDIVIPFDNDEYLFNWVALPETITVPNHYQNQNVPSDEGNLGTPDDLLDAPVLVGGYNLMMGNYPVPITDPLLLNNE